MLSQKPPLLDDQLRQHNHGATFFPFFFPSGAIETRVEFQTTHAGRDIVWSVNMR